MAAFLSQNGIVVVVVVVDQNEISLVSLFVCFFFHLGPLLSPTAFAAALNQARENIRIENAQHPATTHNIAGNCILDTSSIHQDTLQPPGMSDSRHLPLQQFAVPPQASHKWGIQMTEAVYMKNFPFVAKTVPYFLAQEVSIENLVIMNQKASLRDGRSKGIEDRLMANEEKVLATKTWPEAADNLKDVLHPVRFDRMPVTGSPELFRMVSETFDPSEYLPINSYDLSSLGLSNVISHQGYVEAHNPRSSKLSLKMFSRDNFKQSLGGVVSCNIVKDDFDQTAVQTSPQLANIESMSSFHHAFFALFTLIGRSQPWNKSLEVLWLFFINNQWFEKAVVNSAGYTRHEKVFPAHICAQFTDHFLLVSSSRFTNKQCHVTIHEVDALFKNFCQSNLRLFKTGYNASSTVTSQSSTSSTSKPFKRPFSLNTPGVVPKRGRAQYCG